MRDGKRMFAWIGKLNWVLALLFFAATMAAADLQEQQFRNRFGAQVSAVYKEKAARTPAQKKMDSQLIYALKAKRNELAAMGLADMKSSVKLLADGHVLVDMDAEVTPALLKQIAQSGGTVLASFPKLKAIRAAVPLDKAELLAGLPNVKFLRTAVECRTNAGSVDSEGDTTHRATAARDTFGVDGTGVKVGVLSDGVDSLAASQASGNLGTVTVLSGQAGDGDEGTAMLEIVHDLAPGAQLYFATAFTSEASFAENIRALGDAGCDIIVDDVTYFDESPFQDGTVSLAVNDVSADGVLYFSSAGNEGNKDSAQGTACTWEGDFADGGATEIGYGGLLHDFGGSITYNTISGGSSQPIAVLFWSDPLGASTNDYDLYLTNSAGTILGASTFSQDGTQDPYEIINYGSVTVPAESRLVVVKYSGEARFLHLATWRDPLTITTAGNVQGHNASEADNAFCVAAAPASDAWTGGYPAGPYPDPFDSSSEVEPFTSDGPRRMFYYPNGTAITPGNLSSTGGQVYQKPDITAADGVMTSVPGFDPFYGTSAAAPHAAAIAALVKSTNPGLTPAQIRDVLTSTAVDIAAAGWDRDSGAGILMAYDAVLEAMPASAVTLTVNSDPASGVSISGTPAGTTPYDSDRVPGSTVTLTAPESAAGEHTGYTFDHWARTGAADYPAGQRTITFTITAETTVTAYYVPLINVQYPSDAGTSLLVGQKVVIQWQAPTLSTKTKMKIDLINSADTAWPLALSVPNKGSWKWTVGKGNSKTPATYPEGDDYRIRVSTLDGTSWDDSDNPFAIGSVSSIDIRGATISASPTLTLGGNSSAQYTCRATLTKGGPLDVTSATKWKIAVAVTGKATKLAKMSKTGLLTTGVVPPPGQDCVITATYGKKGAVVPATLAISLTSP